MDTRSGRSGGHILKGSLECRLYATAGLSATNTPGVNGCPYRGIWVTFIIPEPQTHGVSNTYCRAMGPSIARKSAPFSALL
jgi:hypothetical protein